jgi:aspartate carbamoyltransferase catalytic subunit
MATIKHVVSVSQFLDKKLLGKLFKQAEHLSRLPLAEYPKPLQHLTLATLFFEPSTRTRLSFETAIQNLGGHLLTVENGDFSSAKKGESLEDTIKTVNAYADGIIIRHPEIGSAARAAAVSWVPIINAGDGAGDHPTQALLDLFTIQKSQGKVDGLKIGIVGDLKHSRTQHSLINLLSIYDVELFLISPKSLQLPKEQQDFLKKQNVKFHVADNWDKVIDQLDVMYINRVQKERFKFVEDYMAVKDSFILTMKAVSKMKPTAVIMDPLPRVGEIAEEVDDDPRAIYFEQVKNGLYVRMALLQYLFEA